MVCDLILCGGRFLCCFQPLDCLGGRSENLSLSTWFVVAPKPKKDKEKKYEGNKETRSFLLTRSNGELHSEGVNFYRSLHRVLSFSRLQFFEFDNWCRRWRCKTLDRVLFVTHRQLIGRNVIGCRVLQMLIHFLVLYPGVGKGSTGYGLPQYGRHWFTIQQANNSC